MATTLVSKETSYSSTSTYYKLELNSLNRAGTELTANFKLTVTLGSGTSCPADTTNSARTVYLYTSAGKLLGSYAVKPKSAAWKPSETYTYTFSITWDTGSTGAYNQTCYIRILCPNSTSITSPCIWNGSKSTSGGSVGATFTLSDDGSSGTIKFNGNVVTTVKFNGTVLSGLYFNGTKIL